MASQFCKRSASPSNKSPTHENNGTGNILIESDHNEINLDSFDEANDFEEPIEVHAAKPHKATLSDGNNLADVMEASDESDS